MNAEKQEMRELMRRFASGAARDTTEGKLDFDGSLSPYALEVYVDYLRRHNSDVHRHEDNWKKGMPLSAFMKSAWRHLHAWWRSHYARHPDTDAICGVLFNAFGYLHECVKPLPRPMLDEHLQERAAQSTPFPSEK